MHRAQLRLVTIFLSRPLSRRPPTDFSEDPRFTGWKENRIEAQAISGVYNSKIKGSSEATLSTHEKSPTSSFSHDL
jgi:hypothetical protein